MPSPAEVGERVRASRTRRGLSQAELGRRVGLGPTVLSKIESGVRSLSSTELADIADALGVSMRDLVGRRSPAPVLAFAHRLGDVGGRTDGVLAAHRVLSDTIELEVLLDELGVPQVPVPELPTLGPPMADPRASGRQLARELRAHLELGDQPIDDVDALMERLGVRVIGRPLGETSSALAGVCTGHPDFRAALINTDQWGTRQRFTAAHELAHLLLGDAADGAHDDHGDDLRSGSTEAQEVRANAFAAEFLLPLSAVSAHVERYGVGEETLAALIFDFGVSLPTAVYRLVDGAHVRRDAGEAMRVLSVANLAWAYGRQDDHAAHAAMKGRWRAPTATHRRAVKAYAVGALGVAPLAGLLGEDPDELRDALDAAGLSPTLHAEVDVLDML